MTSDPNEPNAPEPAAADAERPADARAKKVLAVVVGAYALALVLLVVLDQVSVVWKSLVVPGVALAAALTGRWREFVRDWAVFLAAVVLFDASRGFVYALIQRFELPVYMAYAIDAERALFGDPLLT
ncbi:MAG TPA: hypothetical protein VK509_20985, partial [Polyangiales bacterium]|nr:hypothetical protein [Polyangiales bacterium]